MTRIGALDEAARLPAPDGAVAPQTSATRPPQPPQPPQAPVHGYKALTGWTPDQRPGDFGRDPGERHRCDVHGVGWTGGPECWTQGANGTYC